MAMVHSNGFPVHIAAPTTPRTTARTGTGKAAGNRTRTRIGAAGTGAGPSSIAPRVPKLRDSCNACAAAKVRCTKQKPTCTRCHKSGLDCEYNATRRAGRPSQASTPKPAKVTKPLHQPPKNPISCEVQMPSPPASCHTIPSETTLLASPSGIESPSKQQLTTPCQDTFPNLLESTDATTALPSSLTAYGADFDDFFTSLGSFSGLETPTYDLLPLPNCVDSVRKTMGTNDTASFLHEDNFSITDDAYSDMQFLTDSHTRSNSRQSPTSHTDSVPALWPDTPCCCLITALGFLKELSPNAPKVYNQSCPQQTPASNAEPPFPTIQSVIAQNERIIEAMDSILQCPYSQQDGYLLTVLALVLFKILDWYTAAGRAAPTVSDTTNDNTNNNNNSAAYYDGYNSKIHISPPPHNPYCDAKQGPSRSSSALFAAGGLCVDGEDSGRVAAQMVLSELHRAQRLVNNLSARFKGHGAAPVAPNGGGSGSSSASDGVDMLCDGSGTSWPFSTAVFDQLEADLRRRLRTVSVVVVDMIRRV